MDPDAEPADVFGPAAEAVFKAMKPLDLSSSKAELDERLVTLVRREAELFDCGITCPLKDKPDASCAVCPVSRANEHSGSVESLRRSQLCRIGAEQERVLMLSAVKRDRGV